MEILHTILTVIQVILAVGLVTIITMQSGKGDGLSALAGSSEGFMSKNKTSTMNAKLASATKWIGIAFVVLTLVLNLF